MRGRKEEHYDHRTKGFIRSRLAKLDSPGIVQREYQLRKRRETLINQWVASASENKQSLTQHLDECIKLAEYELGLIHHAMHVRKLIPLPDDIQVVVIEELNTTD